MAFVPPATRSPVWALITSRGPGLCLISLGAQGHLVTFWGRSFVKEPTHTRVSSCERPCYNMRSTADTWTELIVSQVYAALWWPQHSVQRQLCLHDFDSCCRFVSTIYSEWADHWRQSIIDPAHTRHMFSLKWAFLSALQGISKVCHCYVGLHSE